MFLLLISLALISTTSSFLIIDAEPGLLVVEPGQRVNLSCVVDDHYEYCMWHSPTNSMCDFEWKRNKDNITMQDCPLNQNQEKISFHGKYDDRQCGISFIATVEDTGVWRCEVEEYVWGGSRNSGRKVSATMTVTVQASTTNRPRTPPSTTTTTTTSTTSSSTTSTTISSTKSTSSSPTTSTTPTTKAKSTAAVSTVTTKAVDGNSEGSQNTPEAVPRVDSESFDSAGASTAVVVILLVLGSVVGGALYYRRRRMKRPDATAAVVYEREAKDSRDTTNMMRNSNGSEVSGGITDLRTAQLENKNLHEFFPHSESFA